MNAENKEIKALKDAILGEIASDVLHIKDQLEEIKPLITLLSSGIADSLDVVRAGITTTLESIDEDLRAVGSDKVEQVKGQLSVFIEQAMTKSFSENAALVDQIVQQFQKLNNSAANSLKVQYQEVADGLASVKKEVEKAATPSWLKIGVPIFVIVVVLTTSIASWQFASYREAVYMAAFNKTLKQ